MKKINVAVAGLGFGQSFVPIYLDHPNVEKLGVFDIDKNIADKVKEKYPDVVVYNSFEDILNDETMDAVHILSPIPCHAEQSVAVLESGKHCACTVPMATSLEDIKRIVEAKRKSGKNYMMMETTLYTYQFFYVKQMLESGELGRIQFLRGSHYQDMRNWPDYWLGLPPMW
jgi:predicted dehydrogenase